MLCSQPQQARQPRLASSFAPGCSAVFALVIPLGDRGAHRSLKGTSAPSRRPSLTAPRRREEKGVELRVLKGAECGKM